MFTSTAEEERHSFAATLNLQAKARILEVPPLYLCDATGSFVIMPFQGIIYLARLARTFRELEFALIRRGQGEYGRFVRAFLLGRG